MRNLNKAWTQPIFSVYGCSHATYGLVRNALKRDVKLDMDEMVTHHGDEQFIELDRRALKVAHFVRNPAPEAVAMVADTMYY